MRFLLAGFVAAFLAATGAEYAAVPGGRDVFCEPEAVNLGADQAVACVSASTTLLRGMPDFCDPKPRLQRSEDAQMTAKCPTVDLQPGGRASVRGETETFRLTKTDETETETPKFP